MLPAPRDPAEVEAHLWAGWSGVTGWDVGANMGQSVPWLLDRFQQVVAFEPGVEAFAEMAAAWGGNPRVSLRNVAVAGHDGVLTLAVRQAPILTGQLVAVGMPYRGEWRGPGTANWGDDAGTRDMPCVTLDTLAAAEGTPDFVKIDTEGHELTILRGALEMLREGRTSFLIEFHRDDLYTGCLSLLSTWGYSAETVRHPHYVPDSDMWHQHGWLRAPAPKGKTDGA